MGGREAIRGFELQTLLAVLEALDNKRGDWIAVTVEPDSKNDKVDILWLHPGRRRAQQVKSSQNQMGKGEVEAWCKELVASKAADDYELLLSGPVAQSVIDEQPFSTVRVPIPRALDTLALREQASDRLDGYLTRKGIPGVPFGIRADIVELLAHRITDGAISGVEHDRGAFDGMLMQWVLKAYPEAIQHKLAANCEVLWSNLELRPPALAGERAFDITAPITVVNGGLGVAIVEWFVLSITGPQGERRYEPLLEDEFAVLPGGMEKIDLDLRGTDTPGFQSGQWELGAYRFALHMKLRGAAVRMVKEMAVEIREEHRAVLSGRTMRVGERPSLAI